MLKKFLNTLKPYVKLIAIAAAAFIAFKLTENQFDQEWMRWAVVAGVGLVGGMILGNIAEGIIDNVTGTEKAIVDKG